MMFECLNSIAVPFYSIIFNG